MNSHNLLLILPLLYFCLYLSFLFSFLLTNSVSVGVQYIFPSWSLEAEVPLLQVLHAGRDAKLFKAPCPVHLGCFLVVTLSFYCLKEMVLPAGCCGNCPRKQAPLLLRMLCCGWIWQRMPVQAPGLLLPSHISFLKNPGFKRDLCPHQHNWVERKGGKRKVTLEAYAEDFKLLCPFEHLSEAWFLICQLKLILLTLSNE